MRIGIITGKTDEISLDKEINKKVAKKKVAKKKMMKKKK